MRKLVTAIALLAFTPLPAFAQAAAGEDAARFVPIETDATGHGQDRDAAIDNALVNALAQKTGVAVGKITITNIQTGQAEAQKSETSGKPTHPMNVALVPDQQRETESASAKLKMDSSKSFTVSGVEGGIQSYRLMSLDPSPGGGFDARVHAVLELGHRKGGAGDTRRRIAVGNFEGDTGGLSDRLVMDLTQTRRFAVLDRTHDEAYANEIVTIAQLGADQEKIRANQVLGADYVLLGKLHIVGGKTTGHAASSTSHVIGLTGEVVTDQTPSTLHHTQGSAQVDFQLIEIATRQVVIADHLAISGGDVDATASHITGDIMNAIYPPLLISVSDPTALIINQGGNGMHTGERFRVMQEGAELIDPYTHESLGRPEHEAGMIEITDVAPRLSYAKLISGKLPADPADAVLRAAIPAPAMPVMHKAIAHARAVQAEPEPPPRQGGLRFNFDR